jgi:hypothetical protein
MHHNACGAGNRHYSTYSIINGEMPPGHIVRYANDRKAQDQQHPPMTALKPQHSGAGRFGRVVQA